MSNSDKVADSADVVKGVKVTLIVQESPGATIVPFVQVVPLATVKSKLLKPVNVCGTVMSRAAVPELVTVSGKVLPALGKTR